MKPQSRRSWIFGSLALLFLLGCVGFLIWAIHQFGWDWTGFNAYSPPTPQYQRGKTLWDWLQLLVVPAILAAGAGFFTWWSARTERHIAQQRYEQDQKLALDKQQEDLLQSYLDRMAELLLEKGPRNSEPNAEVRKVARTRTISTLIQLDGKRARTIFVFLSEAQLTEETNPIISFENADLSRAKWSQINLSGFNLIQSDLSGVKWSQINLSGFNLSGANLIQADLIQADLSGVNLSRVNLSRAKLSGTRLSGTRLSEADLSGADLSRVDLSGADLSGADLIRANLRRASLFGTDLSGADLSGADLSRANLSHVRFLERARLDKTILRGVKGLTPEQFAYYKARGAIVDEKVTSSASPSQSTPVASSQEAIRATSSSLGQVITLPNVQEIMPEAAISQQHSAVVKEATPSAPSSQNHATSLSSSQENYSPVPPRRQPRRPVS